MVECDVFVGGVLVDDAELPFLVVVRDAEDRQHLFRVSEGACTPDSWLKGRCTGADVDPVCVYFLPDGPAEERWEVEVRADRVRKRGGDGDPARPKGRWKYLGVVTESESRLASPDAGRGDAGAGEGG